MTPLKALATQCGLSMNEAAEYLGMPEPTLRAHWKGQRGDKFGTNPAALQKLHTLSSLIDETANELLRLILRHAPLRKKQPEGITLAVPTSVLSLPYVSVHEEVIARLIGRLPPQYVPIVRIVSRQELGEDLEIY